jgi:hypothetical protein
MAGLDEVMRAHGPGSPILGRSRKDRRVASVLKWTVGSPDRILGARVALALIFAAGETFAEFVF